MLCRLTKPQIRVACIASYPNLRLHSTAYFLCRVKSLYFFVVLLTGCGSSRHPASSILGVTLTPCAEGPCETGCLALLPDISFFWKRCGPRPPVLESTYLSKNAPPTAGISQRRRGRRWRKHSVCMTNALAGACPSPQCRLRAEDFAAAPQERRAICPEERT